jgi:hypothetical protein
MFLTSSIYQILFLPFRFTINTNILDTVEKNCLCFINYISLGVIIKNIVVFTKVVRAMPTKATYRGPWQLT